MNVTEYAERLIDTLEEIALGVNRVAIALEKVVLPNNPYNEKQGHFVRVRGYQ